MLEIWDHRQKHQLFETCCSFLLTTKSTSTEHFNIKTFSQDLGIAINHENYKQAQKTSKSVQNLQNLHFHMRSLILTFRFIATLLLFRSKISLIYLAK